MNTPSHNHHTAQCRSAEWASPGSAPRERGRGQERDQERERELKRGRNGARGRRGEYRRVDTPRDFSERRPRDERRSGRRRDTDALREPGSAFGFGPRDSGRRENRRGATFSPPDTRTFDQRSERQFGSRGQHPVGSRGRRHFGPGCEAVAPNEDRRQSRRREDDNRRDRASRHERRSNRPDRSDRADWSDRPDRSDRPGWSGRAAWNNRDRAVTASLADAHRALHNLTHAYLAAVSTSDPTRRDQARSILAAARRDLRTILGTTG